MCYTRTLVDAQNSPSLGVVAIYRGACGSRSSSCSARYVRSFGVVCRACELHHSEERSAGRGKLREKLGAVIGQQEAGDPVRDHRAVQEDGTHMRRRGLRRGDRSGQFSEAVRAHDDVLGTIILLRESAKHAHPHEFEWSTCGEESEVLVVLLVLLGLLHGALIARTGAALTDEAVYIDRPVGPI